MINSRVEDCNIYSHFTEVVEGIHVIDYDLFLNRISVNYFLNKCLNSVKKKTC